MYLLINTSKGRIMLAVRKLELPNNKARNPLQSVTSELALSSIQDVAFCSVGGVVDNGGSVIVNYMEYSVSSVNHSGQKILSLLESEYVDMNGLKSTLKNKPEITLESIDGVKYLLNLKPRHIKWEEDADLAASSAYADHFFLEFGWIQCCFNKNSKLCWVLSQIS